MSEHDHIPAPRRMHVQFGGRVQGVGFRFTTVQIAAGFDITGYVQNLLDGSVKVIAEGPERELRRFLEAIRQAHIYQYVTDEQLSWPNHTGEFDAFTVHYG